MFKNKNIFSNISLNKYELELKKKLTNGISIASEMDSLKDAKKDKIITKIKFFFLFTVKSSVIFFKRIKFGSITGG